MAEQLSVGRKKRAEFFARRSDPVTDSMFERLEAVESMLEDLATVVGRDKTLPEKIRSWIKNREVDQISETVNG